MPCRSCENETCAPGKVSTVFAFLCWVPWLFALVTPLVRTTLPYTPTFQPDNFFFNTSYTLLDAQADYGAWSYKESGHVLKIDAYDNRTRNSTISYSHRQTFSGVSCNYHVHSVVTGYDSDSTPLGDVYPLLVAPACAMAVCFRALLIVMLIVPCLSCLLELPHDDIKEAKRCHKLYREELVLLEERANDDCSAEGQPPAHAESPSASRRSAPPSYYSRSASLSYNEAGSTLHVPLISAPAAPPLAVGGVFFHHGRAHGARPNTPPAPYYEALHDSPSHPYLPAAHPSLPPASVNSASRYQRGEGHALHTALYSAVLYSMPAGLACVALSVGSYACMFGYVNGVGGLRGQWQWPVYMYVSTALFYCVVVLVEMALTYIPLTTAISRYLQEEGASWQVLRHGAPPPSEEVVDEGDEH